jgi:RecB family endonuclease NucS
MAMQQKIKNAPNESAWRHTLKSYEVRYREILFTGEDYDRARKHFDDLLTKPFKLTTPKETYPDKRFTYDSEKRRIRLPCTYFEKLNAGDVILIQKADNTLVISLEQKSFSPTTPITLNPEKDFAAVRDKVIALQDKIISLQEENGILQDYKRRLEEFENFEYFFADEQEMEEWLIKNMHKVLPDIEPIDQQIWVTWKDLSKNRMDIFAMDKTTRELVVIEVKTRKRRLKTAETQFMFYKTWVLKNLASLNEKYSVKGLRATQDFKFVIMTDFYGARLQEVCQTFGICLVNIDGGIHCEQIVPYRILAENCE